MKRTHSHRLYSIIVSVIIILIVLITALLFWLNSRLCFVDYTPYSYSESNDAIKNPYVGLYSIRGYMLYNRQNIAGYSPKITKQQSVQEE